MFSLNKTCGFQQSSVLTISANGTISKYSLCLFLKMDFRSK